jgi:hypothetical protein
LDPPGSIVVVASSNFAEDTAESTTGAGDQQSESKPDGDNNELLAMD